jgi:CRP-like cAMP-binding protein
MSTTAQPFQNFVVRFDAGGKVFTEGDLGVTMYIVQTGKVRLYKMIDGQAKVSAVLEKGDFFGEASVLEGLPRSCHAEAVEDSELIEINSGTFERMIKGNIEIAVRMLRKLSLRLREAERRADAVEAAGPAPAAARSAGAPRAQAPTAAASGTRLELEGGGTVFPITGNETIIGRFDPVTEMRPDLDLTGVDLKRSVSRRHARLGRGEEGYFLCEEVGALNGTSVNGTKLVTGRPHPVVDGDRIQLGQVKLVFRS